MTHLTSYSERSYPFPDNPNPDHCRHMVAREEHFRLERARRQAAMATNREARRAFYTGNGGVRHG